MSEHRARWKPLMVGGVLFSAIGQALISYFLAAVGSSAGTEMLHQGAFALGAVGVALGTSLFSRSAPGLLGHPPQPTDQRASVTEIMVTAFMIMGTTCLAWLALEIIAIVADTGLPVWERALGAPIAAGAVAVLTLVIMAMGRCERKRAEHERSAPKSREQRLVPYARFWVIVGLCAAALMSLTTKGSSHNARH